ncbi:MAG: mechanosensitive ion channel family protein [Firmicutes bacterium]|nr:mechanosensitive ion channel family protein [Bacillota bacterium]
MDAIKEVAFSYLGRLVLGAVVWFVGKKLVYLMIGFMEKRMAKVEVDDSLRTFLAPLLKGLLQVLLVITVAATVGIEITTFAAIIGAASLAVGLAFQGSLSNFAGGVLILIFKPFKVGDFIEAAGYSGTVREIQVFHTVLQTPDSQKVIIPNADLSNSSAINYSAYENRRATVKLPISFGSDFKLAKEVILKVAENHPLVLKDPAPMVVMGEFGENGPVVWARVWAKRTDYWTMLFDFQEQIKDAIAEAGVEIPYNTMDVNIKNDI